MIRYLISGVYTEGDHKGRQFLLCKGGYVVDREMGKPLPIDCYESEKAAKMVATKLNKRNEMDSRWCKYITPCRYTVSEVNY